MPHATTNDEIQDENEERDYYEALRIAGGPEGSSSFQDRDLDPGEKADDAVDFGDLSDDDLADDDEDGDHTQETPLEGLQNEDMSWEHSVDILPNVHPSDLPNSSAGNGESLDDLFGDIRSSPLAEEAGGSGHRLSRGHGGESMGFEHAVDTPALRIQGEQLHSQNLALGDGNNAAETDAPLHAPLPLLLGITDAALSKEQQMQQALFEMSGAAPRTLEIPGPETQEQALKQLWPRFQPDTVPKFMDLLPPRKARYLGKPRIRIPKPVLPTKISLEIAMDQEKNFRLASASIQKPPTEIGWQNLVKVQQSAAEEERSDTVEDIDSDFEHDEIAGVNWQDLQILCGDWDSQSSVDISSENHLEATGSGVGSGRDDIWDDLTSVYDDQPGPAAKVRMTKLE